MKNLNKLNKERKNLLKNKLNLSDNFLNYIYQDLPNFEKWKKRKIKEPKF